MNRNTKPKRQPTGDYSAGFAKPPEWTRWKKGQSGNPKGRPKGSNSMLALVKGVLNEKVKVREGDVTRNMSMMEALIRVLAQKAMKGDQKSIATWMMLTREANMMTDPDARPESGLIAIPLKAATAEEWLRDHGPGDDDETDFGRKM